jgi:hypothetical protein
MEYTLETPENRHAEHRNPRNSGLLRQICGAGVRIAGYGRLAQGRQPESLRFDRIPADKKKTLHENGLSNS